MSREILLKYAPKIKTDDKKSMAEALNYYLSDIHFHTDLKEKYYNLCKHYKVCISRRDYKPLKRVTVNSSIETMINLIDIITIVYLED